MLLRVFTIFHVLISLVGIATGLVALYGYLTAQHWPLCTAIFLGTTIATSVTGFLFPFEKFLPSHAFGVLSLLLLLFSCLGLYQFHLEGAWRSVYVVTATLALHLNVFVLIAQLFLKVPALKAKAPTQSEPPFLVTEGVVFVLFLAASVLAALRFHPAM